MNKIILASASPRRQQLLKLADIPFTVVVSESAEEYPPGLSPAETALYIAGNKGRAVRSKMAEENNSEGYTIISADTIVVLHDRIFGKPAGREDAVRMLGELSGQTHEVITAVCIFCGKKETGFTEHTQVEFYPLKEEDILYYVDTYKPFDKAGAYAIQEWIGAVAIRSIRGDFYNVMGLPVSRVVQELNDLSA